MQPQARVSCRGRAPRRDGRALRAGGVANPHTDVQRVSSWPMEPRMELREITDLSPAAHVSLRVVHTGHKHAFNTTRTRNPTSGPTKYGGHNRMDGGMGRHKPQPCLDAQNGAHEGSQYKSPRSACVPWLVVVCPARRRMHASIGARAPWLVVLSIVPLPALLFWSSRGTLHQAVCHTRVAGRGRRRVKVDCDTAKTLLRRARGYRPIDSIVPLHGLRPMPAADYANKTFVYE